MPAFLFTALLLLICTGLGMSVVVRLDHDGALLRWERLVAAFVVGAVGMYLAVFAVGLIRLDTVSMSAVMAAAGCLAYPSLRRVTWRDLATDLRDQASMARRSPGLALVWVAVLGVAAASLIQGSAPVNDYDSLMYHLAVPQLDVELGHITAAMDRGIPNVFLPPLMHHLYRLALCLSNAGAVQMISGLMGLVTALAVASLARRMGGGTIVALLAALMFLANRAVIWEMASPEVDVALTGAFTVALLVFMAWRLVPSLGSAVLIGLLLGAACLIKSHGMVLSAALGMMMAATSFRDTNRSARLWHLAVATLVALAVFSPQMVWTAYFTGNPLFPLFNTLFNPDGVAFFADDLKNYGTGRGLVDLLTGPWWMSVAPMAFFDGMVLGAPYYLALAPLAILSGKTLRHWCAILAITVIYYVIWFFFMSQQVRFLMPLYPIFGLFASFGLAALWQRGAMLGRGTLTAVGLAVFVLAINQGMFIAIYAAIRGPVAIGLTSVAAFHAKTPTLGGAIYGPCTYLRSSLQPGERVLSLLWPHSYYCPQAAATLELFPDESRLWLTHGVLPRMPLREFIRRYEDADFRFVIVTTQSENRRNQTGEPVWLPLDLTGKRFGPYIAAAIKGMSPLTKDSYAAVYDGRQILAGLKAGVANEVEKEIFSSEMPK
jgi:hypothetical protein